MQHKTLRSQILLPPMPTATLPAAQAESSPSFPAGPTAHHSVLQREEQSPGSAPRQDGLTAHTQGLETGVLSMHMTWRHLQSRHQIASLTFRAPVHYCVSAGWDKIAPRRVITQPLGTRWAARAAVRPPCNSSRQGSPEISRSRRSRCYRS